jgi:Tfp pilus assembly protein PilV
MKKIIKNKGFMTVEILVATSIITVSILAAMTVAQKSIYVSRQAFHTTQAAFLLEEGAENTRIMRDNAWSNVTTLNSSEQIGIFTRTIITSSVNRDNTTKDIVSSGGTPDSGTKLVTVTIFWTEGGVTITKILQFYIMNIFS